MIGAISLLAKRYAAAWMHIYGSSLREQDYKALNSLGSFLMEHKKQLVLFQVPMPSSSSQLESLVTIAKAFKVESLSPLLSMLVKSKRVFLLPSIIRHIGAMYKEQHGIMSWDFMVSHTVSPDILKALENFLARKTGHVIISTYIIDNNLIAGIRLQSDTLLWEYSIRKQLNDARLPLIR